MRRLLFALGIVILAALATPFAMIGYRYSLLPAQSSVIQSTSLKEAFGDHANDDGRFPIGLEKYPKYFGCGVCVVLAGKTSECDYQLASENRKLTGPRQAKTMARVYYGILDAIAFWLRYDQETQLRILLAQVRTDLSTVNGVDSFCEQRFGKSCVEMNSDESYQLLAHLRWPHKSRDMNYVDKIKERVSSACLP